MVACKASHGVVHYNALQRYSRRSIRRESRYVVTRQYDGILVIEDAEEEYGDI